MNAPTLLWSQMTHEQRIESVRYRFKMGHTRNRIARELGVVYATLTLWCKKNNVTIPPTPPPANARAGWLLLPAAERRRVLVELLESGKYASGNALCTELKCSKSALRKYALKQGLEIPNGRGINLKAASPRLDTGNVPVRRPRTPVATRDVPASYSTPARRPAPDVATRVHVLDHRSDQCRFPLWPDQGRTAFKDMFYCGAPREEPSTSYCADCRRLIRRGSYGVEDREALLTHMHLMRRVRDRAKKG